MKTEQDIKMLKIIWAFMLENGKVTNGEWSYYGGGYASEGNDTYDYKKDAKLKKQLIDEMKSHGVDWSKTGVPDYESHNSFAGTDEESSENECLLGDIYLNNANVFKLGTSEVSEAAKHAYESLKWGNREDPVDLVSKYFGT